MARATRSTKRKLIDDDDDDDEDISPHPLKQLRHETTSSTSTIDSQHASAVLDILDMIDTQGLLDRVFPVDEQPERSSSLRTLLSEKLPIHVLRAAVANLEPISSSIRRAAPSPMAAQQHRFCSLAIDLLNQASAHNAPIPSSIDSILPTSPSKPKPLKYALVQHLPNQDYWTSLNDSDALTDALKLLPTAHSELVAIIPTPSTTQSDKYPVPTLASYAPTLSVQSIKPLPQQRAVTTGAFLDFGPWASFAPTFDHDGELVGRNELALSLYASHERRKQRHAPCESVKEVVLPHNINDHSMRESVDLEQELRELFSPEEAAEVKGALDTLELENAVQELIDRNRRALINLERLQVERLIKGGDRSVLKEGSEEWDTAQGILETLTILASLRPRTSKEPTTIVPPPALLHKLHRTLALSSSTGWHGTLPASRSGALSDDTTFKKSSRAVVPPPTTTTPTPVPATPTPTASTSSAPLAMPYSGYTYAYGQQGQTQPYRPAGVAATTPVAGATTNGYTGYTHQYYAYTAQQQGQQSYYAQQQYPASYTNWYNSVYSQQALQQQGQQQAVSATAAGGRSGTSTPQPQVQPGTYGTFFATAGRTPAVANTVYAPTATATALPPHLRTQVAVASGQQQQTYYPYQPAAQPQSQTTGGTGR
ncbi:hypothetical protein H0H93_001798 [Arthromyces matolae]|nr:hypothetical protein H0H93_001798 [Arthromyces matolae]